MKKIYTILCIGAILFLGGCTREVDIPFEPAGDFLVVDALITDELKVHNVLLFNLPAGESQTIPASGATVTISSETEVYTFTESEPGVYSSTEAFQLNRQTTYQLEITTQAGERYSSSQEILPGSAIIDRVFAIREFNDIGVEGVSIYIDATDVQNQASYFQYTYEETFLVQPPAFSPDNAILIKDFPFCKVGVDEDARPDSKRRCYRTQLSNNLNLLNLENTNQSSVRRHLVRFIPRNRYEISYRYSINAKQNVISEQAYDYFETLGGFVTETNVFSQIQPGFVASNIKNENGTTNNVIGFFTLASVQTQRIFFNYDDFFPGEPLPPFIDDCIVEAPSQFPNDPDDDSCGPLISAIKNGSLLYVRLNEGEIDCMNPPCPFVMVARICGDCEVLGVPEPPPFWED